MSTIINVIISLIVFGLIIFFHELGHFIFAKSNGIYVNEFAVGMGPTLFSFRKKETKYALKLIPMGGYCMMLGEDEEVEDEHSFSSKSVWARLSVVVAGPIFNFILAFILSMILIASIGYDIPRITKFSEGSAAQEAGMEIGDVVTHYNGKRIYNYREILIYSQFDQKGEPITLTIDREGTKQELTFSPKKTENGYLMGIYSGNREKGGFVDVVKYSALELRYYIKTTYLSLNYLITGKLGLKNLSGPVGIVSMMNDTIDQAKEDANGDSSLALLNIVLNMVNFSIMLSANLGVMNLLPLPALDGGRAILLLIEGFFHKKLSADKEGLINTIGFLLLIGLMIVIMLKDILQLLH